MDTRVTALRRGLATIVRLACFGLLAADPALALPPSKGPPVVVAYVQRQVDHLPPLNNEDPPPADEGLAGARLGIDDSNATGKFVGVRLVLATAVVAPDGDLLGAVKALIAKDHPTFVAVDAPAADLLALADMPEARGVLFLNVGASDTRLREADCRADVLHVAPSRAMLTDALMQFLVFKRWTKVLIVAGPHPGDRLYAEAMKRSIRKFGGRLVGERAYDARGADIRDTAMNEFTLVTRASDYDVVAVADEAGEFGTQLVDNTDLPRPVVGTQGLTPAAWGRPVEAWAAVQLQNRFKKLAGRAMTPVDYAGWLAIHSVGEAAVQLKSVDPEAIRTLILSPGFEVGGFKGRALSFRSWDGQLREPIFDLWSGAVVATAPLPGFLHPSSDLDTLGIDKPESACRAQRSPS